MIKEGLSPGGHLLGLLVSAAQNLIKQSSQCNSFENRAPLFGDIGHHSPLQRIGNIDDRVGDIGIDAAPAQATAIGNIGDGVGNIAINIVFRHSPLLHDHAYGWRDGNIERGFVTPV